MLSFLSRLSLAPQSVIRSSQLGAFKIPSGYDHGWNDTDEQLSSSCPVPVSSLRPCLRSVTDGIEKWGQSQSPARDPALLHKEGTSPVSFHHLPRSALKSPFSNLSATESQLRGDECKILMVQLLCKSPAVNFSANQKYMRYLSIYMIRQWAWYWFCYCCCVTLFCLCKHFKLLVATD